MATNYHRVRIDPRRTTLTEQRCYYSVPWSEHLNKKASAVCGATLWFRPHQRFLTVKTAEEWNLLSVESPFTPLVAHLAQQHNTKTRAHYYVDNRIDQPIYGHLL